MVTCQLLCYLSVISVFQFCIQFTQSKFNIYFNCQKFYDFVCSFSNLQAFQNALLVLHKFHCLIYLSEHMNTHILKHLSCYYITCFLSVKSHICFIHRFFLIKFVSFFVTYCEVIYSRFSYLQDSLCPLRHVLTQIYIQK